MLLFEALASADCPICLQPLEFTRSTGPSPQKQPAVASSGACATLAGGESSVRGGGALPAPARCLDLSGIPNGLLSPDALTEEVLRAMFGEHPPMQEALAAAAAAESSSSPMPELGARDDDIVVLSCGHFLHATCLRQMLKHQRGKTTQPVCPVCRLEIKHARSEVTLFRPHTRPPRLAGAIAASPPDGGLTQGDSEAERDEQRAVCAPARRRLLLRPRSGENKRERTEAQTNGKGEEASSTSGGSFVAVDNHSSHSSQAGVVADVAVSGSECGEDEVGNDNGDGAQEEDIQLVSTRQIPLTEAYRDFLQRSSHQMKQRQLTLGERQRHLHNSAKQLEQDCVEVEKSVKDMKKRCDMMTGYTGASDGGEDGFSGGRESSAGAERRRLELLRVCKETKAACDAATQELAAANRENSDLQRQLESLDRKMGRLGQ